MLAGERWRESYKRLAHRMEKTNMASQTITMPRPRRRAGRPRRAVDMARIRQLRNEGKTLNEIAARMGCGRGTVARALARMPARPEPTPEPRMPLSKRASELARSREDAEFLDTEERLRLREHARHLAYRRCGDGMRVDGRDFQPANPKRKGPRWLGIALMAGGLLLWAMGCPVPL